MTKVIETTVVGGRKRRVTGTLVSAAVIGFGIPVAVTVAEPDIASAAGVCQSYTANIGTGTSYNLGPKVTESTGCGTSVNSLNNVYGYNAAVSQYVNGSYWTGAHWHPGSRGTVFMGEDSPASERIEYISDVLKNTSVRLHGSKAGHLSMQY